MSIYKNDSKVARLLSYCYTEEAKLTFLKARIHIFLRGMKGTFFPRYRIIDMLGLDYTHGQLVDKAIQMLIDDESFNVKLSYDRTQVVFPRENQRVW